MMKEGLENINDVESTICQIFEDVLRIGNEYTKRLIKYRDVQLMRYNGIHATMQSIVNFAAPAAAESSR